MKTVSSVIKYCYLIIIINLGNSQLHNISIPFVKFLIDHIAHWIILCEKLRSFNAECGFTQLFQMRRT